MKKIIPFIIIFILLALFYQQLFYTKTSQLPSALIGQTLPHFSLPELFQPEKIINEKELVGNVSLLNVWATWCDACTYEQAMLMKIKNEYHISIYGVNYKDTSAAAKQFLNENGNPFTFIINDAHGDFAIDLGVYGTPETFLLNKKGEIIYRHIGILDEKAWTEILYPLIQKLQRE